MPRRGYEGKYPGENPWSGVAIVSDERVRLGLHESRLFPFLSGMLSHGLLITGDARPIASSMSCI